MRVLCHGLPFFRDYAILDSCTGPHEIRAVSANADTQYRYDPLSETWPQLVLRISREWQPDLALFWTPENDPPPLGVEDSPIPTAVLAGDWNLFFGAQKYNLGRYDVVLSDKAGTEILRNAIAPPRFLFPLYSQDPALHYDDGRDRDIDVLYLGNMNLAHYRGRGPLLERIAMLSDRYKIVLACGVFGAAYGELLRRAKIVFNHSVRGELNLRIFESMASGALAFIEAENAEARDFFVPDQEVILYTQDNLEARLHDCLQHWEQYAETARKARDRVREFACDRRIHELIDWVATQPSTGRPFRSLPEQTQAAQTCLMYASAQHAAYGPLEQAQAARLVRDYPEWALAWSAVGRSLYAPKVPQDETTRGKRCITTLLRAAALAPESAIHAFNAAEACRLWGVRDLEETQLRRCLEQTSVDDAAWLIGGYQSVFWTRWLRALAEGRATTDMLHAEAYARLGQVLLARQETEQALQHLDASTRLDPESTSAIPTHAQWLLDQGRNSDAADFLWIHRDRFFFDFDYNRILAQLLRESGRHADAALMEEKNARMQAAYFPKGYGDYLLVPPGLSATAR